MKLKLSSTGWEKILAALVALVSLTALAEKPVYTASFADFDRRARSGKPVSVVFFGGSLTWGSGASDPGQTSFRALTQAHLMERYPSAHFDFHNAAIVGTGSSLGMFRVADDVLLRRPDLVFLEFTTEDELDGVDRQTLASYERILRELISQGIPVVEILLGTRDVFGPDWNDLGPTRFRDHLEMGKLYHTGIGNPYPAIQRFFRVEKRKRDQIWPEDGIYPNDLGHQFFFEAVRDGLDRAIRAKQVCYFPTDAVFADEYKILQRIYPARFPLPTGWRAAKTLHSSEEPILPSNEGMNEVAVADCNDESLKPIRFSFSGTFLGILGEADENAPGFKVSVDGDPVYFNEKKKEKVWPACPGSVVAEGRYFWHVISPKLTPGRHTVEILPLVAADGEKGELRIESICFAGPASDAPQSISAQATGL